MAALSAYFMHPSIKSSSSFSSSSSSSSSAQLSRSISQPRQTVSGRLALKGYSVLTLPFVFSRATFNIFLLWQFHHFSPDVNFWEFRLPRKNTAAASTTVPTREWALLSFRLWKWRESSRPLTAFPRAEAATSRSTASKLP
jgi:hypothetical protein